MVLSHFFLLKASVQQNSQSKAQWLIETDVRIFSPAQNGQMIQQMQTDIINIQAKQKKKKKEKSA